MIFGQTCHKCGGTCEPFLVEIGQVLVVSCGRCLAHIRYGHIYEYPILDNIKVAIWDLCLRNEEVVKLLFNGKTYPRREYWRVYRELFHKYHETFGSYYTT